MDMIELTIFGGEFFAPIGLGCDVSLLLGERSENNHYILNFTKMKSFFALATLSATAAAQTYTCDHPNPIADFDQAAYMG